jgi:crossover junction endodeoxyribonuclease RuvC
LKILGLDPGSLHTGYGLIEKQGSALAAVEAGRFSCAPELPLPNRLAELVGSLGQLLARVRPDLAVLESPFLGRSSRSLIVLAQARGALLATVAASGVEVREYSPAEVKVAVTGSGRADKGQVARMVRLLLALDSRQRLASDATDALAVAICGAQRLRLDRLAVK